MRRACSYGRVQEGIKFQRNEDAIHLKEGWGGRTVVGGFRRAYSLGEVRRAYTYGRGEEGIHLWEW